MLPFYVADFLHLVKKVRSRLLKYVMGIRWKDKVITFRSCNIDRLLHLGAVLADKGWSISLGASPMQRTGASPVIAVRSTQTLPEYSSNDIKRNLSDPEIRRK
jgi:hypothetical protein